MDFSWTDAQIEFRDRVVEFARDELDNSVVQDEKTCTFPRENWSRCAEFGIQGLSLPGKFTGNDDVDFTTAILAMEALGYGCEDNGLAFALNAQMWTVQHTFVRFVTD